jgi:hypothetical protein
MISAFGPNLELDRLPQRQQSIAQADPLLLVPGNLGLVRGLGFGV